jgi:hypothetical protein
MRWTLLVGLLLLAGCQGVVGPVRRTFLSDEVDDPRYTIDEQRQRARDRLGLPEDSSAVGPRTDADLPLARRGVPLR